jgi:hypothetical protein
MIGDLVLKLCRLYGDMSQSSGTPSVLETNHKKVSNYI